MRDPLYEAWLERNTYSNALIYSALIGVLLPAFHYILLPASGVRNDSLALRLLCTAVAAAVAATLLLVPKSRRHAEALQMVQVLVTVVVIDMLVVDSNDQYLYIASALLVTIGVQNAFFRSSLCAAAMAAGFAGLAVYSAMRGIFWEPYNLTTLAIFFTAYCLAYIPASMHIHSRESDIRSRMHALRAQSELEEAHAITHLGKWSQDLRTGEAECSAEMLRILGLPLDTPSAALPELYSRSIHPDDRERVEAEFARGEREGEFSIDHRIVARDGTVRWVQLSGKQEYDANGAPSRRLGIVIDITERKIAQVSLEILARYDPLTNLPNRSMLHDELAHAVTNARPDTHSAILFLDLDRFKDINDSLGHSVGDLLLQEVAARIRTLLPPGTTVARWGGDEFVAVLANVDDENTVERTCRRLVHGLATPFTVDTYEFAVTASVGAALYPRDGTDPEVLIRNADTAMYAAKEDPGRRYAFFAPEMHVVAAMRHQVQNHLQTALATGSLLLHYQPIIDALTNEVRGAEALLRWTDDDGRLHLPADFISIAEDTGSIIPIGMWVVEQAARQAVSWNRAGMKLSVAVNISPRQLAHPDFVQMLAHVMHESKVDPALLEIEITESGLIPNAPEVLHVLESVRRMGVRIAADDFGTGYSAFSYLKQLPLNSLKIDRTFVDGIERDVDRSIAESIIAIAHKLHLSVVAEGVETPFQRKILLELGCDMLQGFDICRPVPTERFEEFARMSLAASG